MTATIQEKRELLTSLLKKGGFASVTYKKATTGEIVTRNIKLWVERHLTSGDRNNIGVNKVAEANPDVFPYSDMEKDAFRSFKLSELISFRAAGKEYNF